MRVHGVHAEQIRNFMMKSMQKNSATSQRIYLLQGTLSSRKKIHARCDLYQQSTAMLFAHHVNQATNDVSRVAPEFVAHILSYAAADKKSQNSTPPGERS